MKIAIVGAGIAGLGCAHALGKTAQITLFEAAPRLGGHTNTVDITVDGMNYPVDTGFLVFNERTYPNLIRLLAELNVPTARSDMSFAVSVAGKHASQQRIEWSGSDLSTVFAQRRNLMRPAFLSMLADILRFNRQTTRIAEGREQSNADCLGEFLDRHRYGHAFRHWYLLPMAGAIWSCPLKTMLAYPIDTFIRFCHNHGLLQITNRPQWWTVQGGARQYVQKIAAGLKDIRLNTPVLEVSRTSSGEQVQLRTAHSTELFDQVVLACHSDQSLRLLIDARPQERELLTKVRYQPNRALLHTDTKLLPLNQHTWSAWNYMSDGHDDPQVAVTYLLNKLQPLPFRSPVMVSLNPLIEPQAGTVLAEFDYAHPVFDRDAISAQTRLAQVQGRERVWFAGAWTGYGFHEDGLRSGLTVATALNTCSASDIALAQAA